MIESEIVNEKYSEFPKLMESSDLIVLFFEDCSGVVIKVKSTLTNMKIGERRDLWIMQNFTDFKGDLILRNK